MATILSLSYWLWIHAQWYRGDTQQSALESCLSDLDGEQYDYGDLLCRSLEREVGSSDNSGVTSLSDVYLLYGDFNMGVG